MSHIFEAELLRQMQNAPWLTPERARQSANWQPSSENWSRQQGCAPPLNEWQPTRPVPPPPSAPGIWQRLGARLGRLWRKTALWLAFSAMALGGCASSQPSAIPTVIRTPPPTVPPTLLRCAPEPMAPDPATSTQRDVAAFLFDLAEAGQDCRRKLGVTRRLLDTYARETDR